MSKTRWKLKKAIKIVNEALSALKHPLKTFVDRISQGFDFLGYRLSDTAKDVAKKTIENFVERLARLKERKASDSRLGEYVKHWIRWAKAGLSWELPFVERISGAVGLWLASESKWSLWPEIKDAGIVCESEGNIAFYV